MIARRKERRIHGPPAHDQVDNQPDWILVEKPPAHGKEQLFAPLRLLEKHRGNRVHIEERTMIRHQQQRAFARRGLNMFEAVDVHDVVSGEMNPAGAHRALAPRPETLPLAAVHAPHETVGKALKT